MAKIDESELERIIAAMKNRKFANPLGGSDFTRPPVSKNRRAIAKLVESAAKKAGLDVSKIDEMLAEDQKALRGAFDKQQAEAARHFPAADAAFRSGMATRLKALELLATPFTSRFVKIVRPFLIWQLPNLEQNISFDPHIETANNSVKFLVNTNGGSDNTEFVFFFLWENESDLPVVANVYSGLVLNGSCSVQAATGILSGDHAEMDVQAWLTLIRWIGWGTDPVTGASNDQTPDPNFQQTQWQQVAGLQATGGNIFEHADYQPKSFSFQPFPLSHDLFIIPGKASVIFQVSLWLAYDFYGGDVELGGGGNISDNVTADFSTNGNAVVCPDVELEILAPYRPQPL